MLDMANARQPAVLRPVLVLPGHVVDHCTHCDVRSQSVCGALPAEDLAHLALAARSIKVGAGHMVFEETANADSFFNITSGTARLFKLLPDGRRQITGFVGRGSFLGLAAGTAHAISAEAITDIQLCRFTRTDLMNLLSDFPALERRLLTLACNDLAAAQAQMLLLGRKSARERLACFLVAQSRVISACGHPQMHLHLPMTRTDIADYLGLTIETVSRSFSALKKEKLIALPSASEVMLCDLPALLAIAEGED